MFPDDQHVNPAVLRTHGGAALGKAAASSTDAKTHRAVGCFIMSNMLKDGKSYVLCFFILLKLSK